MSLRSRLQNIPTLAKWLIGLASLAMATVVVVWLSARIEDEKRFLIRVEPEITPNTLGEIVYAVDSSVMDSGRQSIQLGFIQPQGMNSGMVEISVDQGVLFRSGANLTVRNRLVPASQWVWSLDGSSLHSLLWTAPVLSGYPIALSDTGLTTCLSLDNGISLLQAISRDYVITYETVREPPYGYEVALFNLITCSVDTVLFQARSIRGFQVSAAGWMALEVEDELIIFHPDGHQRHVFARTGGIPFGQVFWSPNSEWLAVFTGSEIYVMRRDGTDLRLLLQEDDMHPHLRMGGWSRQGNRVLFDRSNSETWITEIGTVDIDTGEVTVFAHGGLNPTWRWNLSSDEVDQIIRQLREVAPLTID